MVDLPIRVIYGDTDQMGVVYYANHFRYFEASRNELFRSAGLSYAAWEKSGYLLPVIEAHCHYQAPARYDDLLNVRLSVAEVRRVSMRLEYVITRPSDQVRLATGHTVHACVGPDHKLRTIPDTLRALLNRHHTSTP